ncbi:hypothetical protein B5X24_HaOG203997 [Helicoverpa armigera]|uniref:Uncharacterized protein n=1 Tax=Helicoverpa armigera TaxID=29058 RepID=A0A2W1BYU4_HELAM|nr:hypothetical protein B5X24_HaOG203997 [Helicoverpa armigera]
MSYITLVLSVCLFAAVASSSQQDKRSVISIEPAAWPGVAAWVQSGHGGWSSDTSSDVAGAVAAAKAAATAVAVRAATETGDRDRRLRPETATIT